MSRIDKPLPFKMPERDLQSATIELAQVLGWRVAHFRPAQTQSGNWVTPVAANGKGFPDLVMYRERVIFVELKSDKGALTPNQWEWLFGLNAAGAEVHVWRPEHWYDGTIEKVLRKRAIGADRAG